MKQKFLKSMMAAILLFCGAVGAWAGAARPHIQLAILLDTSNSMDGLINQARTQIWKIVSELAQAKQEGQSPELQVALYEYGKSDLAAADGYMRLILPLTTDLDKVSEELFALKTNGGDEYCGMVIEKAAQQLKWSTAGSDLKLMFISGNEPFTQGTVDYRRACKEAIAKGISVNTIFCGAFQEGVDTFWKSGADLADGRYINIDQNRQEISIPAPQDAEIARLNVDLNKTYVGYGAKGEQARERQRQQDANAGAASPQVMAQRVAAKSTSQYRNSEWDLVDAQKDGKVKVSEMKEEELPEQVRRLPKAEREKYLRDMQEQREQVQKKIQSLSREREKYLQAQQKKQSSEASFDQAVIKALHEQAAKKNFRFDK